MFPETGARKKKWLTDSVDIIPFPNQALRDRVTNTSKPLAPSVPQVAQPLPKQDRTSEKPVGGLNTTHLSIKKMLEKQDAEIQTSSANINDLPRNSFSTDDVKMLWRRYAFEMKEKGLETYYNALIKREPIIDEDLFILEVDNQIQIDYINANLTDMVAHFRKSLGNYFIDIQLRLNANPEKEIKFLSGKDKFSALARKNPNLHTLKNIFNLDIEY